MKPRDNLSTKYPRCHYNKLGKTKMTFDTTDLAEKYLKRCTQILIPFINVLTVISIIYHTQIKKQGQAS